MLRRTAIFLVPFLIALGACNAAPPPVPTTTPEPADTPRPRPTSTSTPSVGTPGAQRLYVVVTPDPPSIQWKTKGTLKVDTLGGALCSLLIADPVGTKAGQFFPQVADSAGHLNWTWSVAADTPTGTYHATSECVLGSDKATGSATLRVFQGG